MNSPFQRSLPHGLEVLYELALDLRWNERCAADLIWERLDPEAWERTNNPYMILENISEERLEEISQDEEFKKELQFWMESRKKGQAEECWFDRRGYCYLMGKIAYFSMEFGLSEALPIYSGGLGILAGDHLKTASDLGVPLIGIGLLYQQGYFHQVLANDGSQIEAFPYNDPSMLPVVPVRKKDGSRLRIKLLLPGRDLFLRVWKAQVGRVDLYLLDSNDPLNSPWDRASTANLYDPGEERRLIQEIVLGVGGWLVLEAMGIDVDVCHINEGHASFLVLSRAYSFMMKHKVHFSVALWATRAGNVFTTHTSVAAGFDSFDKSLIDRYARWAAEAVGITAEELLNLGRANPEDENSSYVMALLAMRGCSHVNGVSRLHGEVSRRIFQPLFPRWPQAEVPVEYVTNGVHVSSWESPETKKIWGRACGYEHKDLTDVETVLNISRLGDAELWSFRAEERKNLVDYVRRRLIRQLQEHGADAEKIQKASHVLDPNALTIGFARRFASYKRPTLLLRDADRFARILKDSRRPVQFIVAGKAHPKDEEGKRMVKEMAQFASRPDLFDKVVFLEDYDIALAQKLLSGVDLWINVPRRPMEASGTSGMKILANGGLNLSVLDGWWAEAYDPEVGWSLGDGHDYLGPQQDESDAEQLYRLLEEQVIPEFYTRASGGFPSAWIARIRASISKLTPMFSSDRMMREYVEKMYLTASETFKSREAEGCRLAKELDNWAKKLAENWSSMRFLGTSVSRDGEDWKFEVQIYLGEIDPSMVKVELYADPMDDKAIKVTMTRECPLSGVVNGYLFRARLPATRPANHYTPRIVPYHPAALIPLEESHIAWEH
jgi:starch phosphorylase